jgi:hypothetical protein
MSIVNLASKWFSAEVREIDHAPLFVTCNYTSMTYKWILKIGLSTSKISYSMRKMIPRLLGLNTNVLAPD